MFAYIRCILEDAFYLPAIKCLDGLTNKQRQCIELGYYNGLTYAEVAQRLSTNLSTIKSRMQDALLSLRGCLGVP